MPLPTPQQLMARQKEMEDKRTQLEEAYQAFVLAWRDIAHSQDDVLKELQQMDEKQQMYSVLKQIEGFK